MIEFFSELGKTFRIGGDEFVSILHNCSKEEIELKFSKMENRIQSENRKRNYNFSIAWGYDEFLGCSKQDYDDFYKIIDKKMYAHKEYLRQLQNIKV